MPAVRGKEESVAEIVVPEFDLVDPSLVRFVVPEAEAGASSVLGTQKEAGSPKGASHQPRKQQRAVHTGERYPHLVSKSVSRVYVKCVTIAFRVTYVLPVRPPFHHYQQQYRTLSHIQHVMHSTAIGGN